MLTIFQRTSVKFMFAFLVILVSIITLKKVFSDWETYSEVDEVYSEEVYRINFQIEKETNLIHP
jgi:hypothetical protein